MSHAIIWQRIEGGLVFLSAQILVFAHLEPGLAWWAMLLVFFGPDLGFLGYLLGARIGAQIYNLLHLYGTNALILAIGLVAGLPALAGIGALLMAHVGFDRMLGYGLKSPEGFSFTHLGRIGRDKDTAMSA